MAAAPYKINITQLVDQEDDTLKQYTITVINYTHTAVPTSDVQNTPKKYFKNTK